MKTSSSVCWAVVAERTGRLYLGHETSVPSSFKKFQVLVTYFELEINVRNSRWSEFGRAKTDLFTTNRAK